MFLILFEFFCTAETFKQKFLPFLPFKQKVLGSFAVRLFNTQHDSDNIIWLPPLHMTLKYQLLSSTRWNRISMREGWIQLKMALVEWARFVWSSSSNSASQWLFRSECVRSRYLVSTPHALLWKYHSVTQGLIKICKENIAWRFITYLLCKSCYLNTSYQASVRNPSVDLKFLQDFFAVVPKLILRRYL